MKSFAIAAAAVALPLAYAGQIASTGGALVINQCNYDIPLKAVPADNVNVTSATLDANGGTWFQNWVRLDVAGGWSIKLDTIDSWTNIMQYEYTWATDNQIWYDMSFVDGVESQHPKWQFVCPDCSETPTNNAYQHSTDDANGMQKPTSEDVTVTLIVCPGNAASGSATASTVAATSAAASTTVAATSSAAAVPTTLATSASSSSVLQLKQAAVETPSPVVPAFTRAAEAPSPVVVTAYEYEVVTALVYETEIAQAKHKRHAHGHPHGRA